MNFPQPLSAETFVRAAVRVVLPWSMWPMVPTFTCGLLRSNFSLAMSSTPLRFYCEPLLALALRSAFAASQLRRDSLRQSPSRAGPAKSKPREMLDAAKAGADDQD